MLYTISQVAKRTGFTTHTLRYYEKIGILSSPQRTSGKRLYSEGDVRLLTFLKLLKSTGMSLEDIHEFLIDGCLLDSTEVNKDRSRKIHKRIEILQKHLLELKNQKNEIETIINLTEEKLDTYREMIEGEPE
ncbi:MerR family transcriptional regulator [Fredinandcohnia humi]